MTFRQFALRNVQGHWQRYLTYFLSSVFAVTVFYLYASFIFHPDVVSGNIRGRALVQQGMVAAEVVILVFSFFFVLYSNEAFIRSRKKEFGLLTLFGMTRRQLQKLVYYENTLVSTVAILAGLALGTLFLKLFLMGMTELLDVETPLRFQLVPKAVLLTAAGYFLLYQLITLVMLFRIRRQEVVDLLKESRKMRPLPAFSVWLVLVAAVCIGAGYAMAYTVTLMSALVLVLPIVILTTVGTYFLYTQASVAFFRWLRKNRHVAYQGPRLVTISQLIFKLRDNARVLFLVSIINAVVLTATGAVYITYQDIERQYRGMYPQTFSFVEKGAGSHQVIHPEKVKAILQEDGAEVAYETRQVIFSVPARLKNTMADNMWSGKSVDVELSVMSNSDYNRLAANRPQLSPLELKPGEAGYALPDYLTFDQGEKQLTTQIMGERATFRLVQRIGVPLLTIPELGRRGAGFFLILSDADYQRWMQVIPEQEKYAVYAYELKNWQTAQPTIDKIVAQIPKDQREHFVAGVDFYLSLKQSNALTLFIGMFVSLLFFIAGGSLIYFKMITELPEDASQYQMLSRLGMTGKELKRVVTSQVALLFFIPFFVGVLHAVFAYKAIGNLLMILGGAIDGWVTLWMSGLTIFSLFFLLQLVYFLLTRNIYLRSLSRASR